MSALGALGALGLDGIDEQVYRGVVRHPGHTRDELAGLLGRAYDEVAAALRRLMRLGLVELRGQQAWAAPPGEALTALAESARRELAERRQQLAALRQGLSSFLSDYAEGEGAEHDAAPFEVVAGLEAVNAVLAELTAHGSGELLVLLRPPMSAPPPAPLVLRPHGDPTRPARTVCQADFLHERVWWQRVRELSGSGDVLRVAAQVPTKLLLVTGYAAMLPLDYGTQDGNNGLLVRDPATVALLTALFERVWESALPVGALDPAAPEDGSAGVPHLEGFADLLALLAAGAKDETIARQLDLSVRTVRRHVAALLEAVGARTRFQAGVQAVQRGWL